MRIQFVFDNNNNNIIKQSLKRKRPSRKYVVFREVLHRNKKVLKTKNRAAGGGDYTSCKPFCLKMP